MEERKPPGERAAACDAGEADQLFPALRIVLAGLLPGVRVRRVSHRRAGTFRLLSPECEGLVLVTGEDDVFVTGGQPGDEWPTVRLPRNDVLATPGFKPLACALARLGFRVRQEMSPCLSDVVKEKMRAAGPPPPRGTVRRQHRKPSLTEMDKKIIETANVARLEILPTLPESEREVTPALLRWLLEQDEDTRPYASNQKIGWVMGVNCLNLANRGTRRVYNIPSVGITVQMVLAVYDAAGEGEWLGTLPQAPATPPQQQLGAQPAGQPTAQPNGQTQQCGSLAVQLQTEQVEVEQPALAS
jgi:hypothetical protein